jgi:hypothetical protein
MSDKLWRVKLTNNKSGKDYAILYSAEREGQAMNFAEYNKLKGYEVVSVAEADSEPMERERTLTGKIELLRGQVDSLEKNYHDMARAYGEERAKCQKLEEDLKDANEQIALDRKIHNSLQE